MIETSPVSDCVIRINFQLASLFSQSLPSLHYDISIQISSAQIDVNSQKNVLSYQSLSFASSAPENII